MTEHTRESDEQHRLSCEARYWAKWARANGRPAWSETKARIAKKRGQPGLNRLLAEMNK